jgi:hypothetical protein
MLAIWLQYYKKSEKRTSGKRIISSPQPSIRAFGFVKRAKGESYFMRTAQILS